MSGELSGKVAIVTGAAMGNGKAIGLGLVEAGADLVVADVDAGAAKETVDAAVGLGRRATVVSVDVSRRVDVERMTAHALAEFGQIDILVNNAGVTSRWDILELPETEWDRVLAINLKGVFLCTQAVARVMVDSGRGGKIINISSTAAKRGVPDGVHYSASKGGVEQLTRATARALASRGVYVNAIAPGVMDTPLLQPFLADPERREHYARSIPLGRIGHPRDLVGAAVFLASDASDFVTGTVVRVDGGALA